MFAAVEKLHHARKKKKIYLKGQEPLKKTQNKQCAALQSTVITETDLVLTSSSLANET